MQKKVSFSFSHTWLSTQKGNISNYADAVLENLKNLFAVEVLDHGTASFTVIINDETDETVIRNKLTAVLQSNYSLSPDSGAYQIRITDYYIGDTSTIESIEAMLRGEKTSPSAADTSSVDAESDIEKLAAEISSGDAKEPPKAFPSSDPASPAEDNTTSAGSNSILQRINGLIGADEFKKLAEECVRIAPVLRKHNTVETFTHQAYIFAINDGAGLSTYLSHFADLLSSLQLFSFSAKNRAREEKLAPPKSREDDAAAFNAVLNRLKKYGDTPGQLVCIDISEWMTKLSDKSFRDFLYSIDDQTGDNIIVFRVPFVEREVLNELKESIGDILFVRDISFVPFDSEELKKCAEAAIEKLGFTIEDDAWEIFDTRITEEKSDGKFYGINTVNKVIREMIYRKQLHNVYNGVDDTVIKKSEILSLAISYSETGKSGMELLDDMIGMEFIKKRVEEIVLQIETANKNKALGNPCIHMRFVGNPGTGKTTVARVVGKILKERGILRYGNFFEYAGRDFCGRYIGETAPKTAAMCRDAYGSVMFVDEAYSLYREGESGKDYGKEAIDTLIAEMENHRSDLVVIMAGYTDEMDHLMKANPGLESRMPYRIEFPNYTREQLFEIFMQMTEKSFTYQEGFREAVKEYFTDLPDEVIGAKEFSNARFVRNLFERTWGKAVLRSQLNKQDSSVLTKEDFILASSEKEFGRIMQKPAKKLGFR